MDRICISKDCELSDICKNHEENYDGEWMPSEEIEPKNCVEFENKDSSQ